MNMKKPEMKIMRFVNEDVIATSGATPPAFELWGFYDGTSDNLETFVDGIKYNGGSALKDALDNKYGGDNYDLLLNFSVNGMLQTYGFDIKGFEQASGYDNRNNTTLVNANGKYTYSSSYGYSIIFTKISTQ